MATSEENPAGEGGGRGHAHGHSHEHHHEEKPRPFTACVVAASDKGSRGERQDGSGDTLEKLLAGFGATSVERVIVPDERDVLRDVLKKYSGKDGAGGNGNSRVDLIITTGGTGMGPRDVTPEATLDVVERQTPGFVEAVRAESLKITPRAMLSRAAAGIAGSTLIINFPGSPKACEESFAVIEPSLAHALDLLAGTGGECAR
ncbi:MAG: MogA/MoaB family molybdenum cofactor biosynthesis protein [Actinomycetota bacterium]